MRTRGKSVKKIKGDFEAEKAEAPQNNLSVKKSARKMKKNADDMAGEQSRNQKKITSYLGLHAQSQPITQPEQIKQTNSQKLREELNQKDQQIKKIQIQKQILQNKYSKLFLEMKAHRIKAKQAILEIVTQQAAYIRKQKGRIDLKLGYYSTNQQTGRRQFVQGDYFQNIQRAINKKEKQLDKMECELRKSRNGQSRARAEFAIKFIKNGIKELEDDVVQKKHQLEIYKSKLRLHLSEISCYYAKGKWPLVSDLNGIQRYQTLELLGKGGYGEVYKCYDIQDDEYVALKIIDMGNFDDDFHQCALKHAVRQIQTHKKLKHLHFVKIKQIVQTNKMKISFVLEFCEGPELSKYLKKQKCLEEKQVKQIMYQIFDALSYLGELQDKVIHYDLKPSNITFHGGIVKILDFGLCKLMQNGKSRIQLTSQGTGTYWYLPPEAFNEDDSPQISSKVDIWSAGVIFFQLLYGVRPFAHNFSQRQIGKHNLIERDGKQVKFPTTNPKLYKISNEAKQLIKLCLTYDPEQRISAKEVFNHPYFQKQKPQN